MVTSTRAIRTHHDRTLGFSELITFTKWPPPFIAHVLKYQVTSRGFRWEAPQPSAASSPGCTRASTRRPLLASPQGAAGCPWQPAAADRGAVTLCRAAAQGPWKPAEPRHTGEGRVRPQPTPQALTRTQPPEDKCPATPPAPERRQSTRSAHFKRHHTYRPLPPRRGAEIGVLRGCLTADGRRAPTRGEGRFRPRCQRPGSQGGTRMSADWLEMILFPQSH